MKPHLGLFRGSNKGFTLQSESFVGLPVTHQNPAQSIQYPRVTRVGIVGLPGERESTLVAETGLDPGKIIENSDILGKLRE